MSSSRVGEDVEDTVGAGLTVSMEEMEVMVVMAREGW